MMALKLIQVSERDPMICYSVNSLVVLIKKETPKPNVACDSFLEEG